MGLIVFCACVVGYFVDCRPYVAGCMRLLQDLGHIVADFLPLSVLFGFVF